MKGKRAAMAIPGLSFAGMLSTTPRTVVCPRHMDGIETSEHPLLEVNGRDKIRFLHSGMGSPVTDSANWFRAIYDNFVTPEAPGRYFFETTIWGGTFVWNDDEWLYGMCNTQGQCVQGHLQLHVEATDVLGYLPGLWGLVGNSVEIPYRLVSLEVGYSHPDTGKISREFLAKDGQFPVAEPTTGNPGPNADCLDNEGNVTIPAEDRYPESSDDRDEWIEDPEWDEEEAYGGFTRYDVRCGWSTGYDSYGEITPTYTCG